MCPTTDKRLSRMLLLLTCFCILNLGRVYSQSLDIRFFPVSQEVLSNKSVRTIVKDSLGFVWFGTVEGLFRFDGTNVKAYEHNPTDSASLTHNTINAVIEDHHHNLWIGTAQGLVIYDREKDNFINVDAIPTNKNHINNGYITALAEDAEGKIWIGTMGGGINIYDPQRLQFLNIFSNNSKDNYVGADYITSLLVNDDNVWCGTRAGLKIYSARTLQSASLSIDDNDVVKKEVTTVIKGKGQNLWIGMANGDINELVFHNNRYRIKSYAHPNDVYERKGGYIHSMTKDRSDNLWIATENGGVSYLDVHSNKVTQFLTEEGNVFSVPSISVRSIYVDDHAMVWVGMADKGVCFIDNSSKKFELYQRNHPQKNTLVGNNVKAFAQRSDGKVWLTTSDGLNLLTLNTRALTNPVSVNEKLRYKFIMTMTCDANDNLWVGTWREGVFRINPKTFETKKFNVEGDGTGNNNVLCVYEDKRGNIWVGTSGSGLYLYNRAQQKFVQLSEKGKTDYVPDRSYVTSVLEDSDGIIWVGTLYGLFALKREGDQTFTYTAYYQNNQPGSLSSSAIECIYEDNKKNLWFGTNDRGLNGFNKQKQTFTAIQKQHGLSSNVIRGILTDAKGNLWISSDVGISKFNPLTGAVNNYLKEDGLNSNNFNGHASLKTRSGEFIFGGTNGFNIFYPDSITDNKTKPTMYLTDLKINNQPVAIGSEDSPLKKQVGLTQGISLSHEQRSFIIDFVAITYGTSSRSQYCYKLEGFEDSWNCTGSNNRATYTNIDAGNYVFLVKGTNSDGVWADVPARLEITVYPPYWKTWWATLLYILVIAAIIYFLVRIKTERIKITNQLNLEKMEREKEHELTVSKMQFFTNISHELRTPLSLIIAPLETLTSGADIPSKIKEQLSITYRNARKMIRLVNELMDFRKLDEGKINLAVQHVEIVSFISTLAANFTEVANRRNINFIVQSHVPSCEGWIDKDKVETILSNLLTNAFKFVDDNGQIIVIINQTNNVSGSKRNGIPGNDILELIVTDNGIGIAAAELPYIFEKFYQAKSTTIKKSSGTGIGLALVKGLAELHHGTIRAESAPNHETRFTLQIPIDRDAYSDEELFEASMEIIESELESETEIEGTRVTEEDDNPIEKPQILLVEDNDELRDYLANELSKNFVVLQASDGQAGVELALSKTPDLIVSDIVMPKKGGIELCAEIKSDMRTSHIPIILLTAKTTVENQIEGISTGADVYLPKPFNMRVLKVQIKQLIDLRRKLYAVFSQDVYIMPAKIAQNEIDQAFLQKAIDYIVENITNTQLNVETLADIFNISRSQVYRKIKALTGSTAVDFIRTIRLKQAIKLMDTQHHTLAEIAYKTGFASPSYFTKSFKEQYGKAPSEYLTDKFKV